MRQRPPRLRQCYVALALLIPNAPATACYTAAFAVTSHSTSTRLSMPVTAVLKASSSVRFSASSKALSISTRWGRRGGPVSARPRRISSSLETPHMASKRSRFNPSLCALESEPAWSLVPLRTILSNGEPCVSSTTIAIMLALPPPPTPPLLFGSSLSRTAQVSCSLPDGDFFSVAVNASLALPAPVRPPATRCRTAVTSSLGAVATKALSSKTSAQRTLSSPSKYSAWRRLSLSSAASASILASLAPAPAPPISPRFFLFIFRDWL
mmetsp:Transcript_14335/g.37690  ORF Transcript_14335/g.37690 Transcript_14335/m.37690 type:complete len:267 (+) Transcript_14335:1408-2208(+)